MPPLTISEVFEGSKIRSFSRLAGYACQAQKKHERILIEASENNTSADMTLQASTQTAVLLAELNMTTNDTLNDTAFKEEKSVGEELKVNDIIEEETIEDLEIEKKNEGNASVRLSLLKY